MKTKIILMSGVIISGSLMASAPTNANTLEEDVAQLQQEIQKLKDSNKNISSYVSKNCKLETGVTTTPCGSDETYFTGRIICKKK